MTAHDEDMMRIPDCRPETLREPQYSAAMRQRGRDRRQPFPALESQNNACLELSRKYAHRLL